VVEHFTLKHSKKVYLVGISAKDGDKCRSATALELPKQGGSAGFDEFRQGKAAHT
jgi:hypothetical protein